MEDAHHRVSLFFSSLDKMIRGMRLYQGEGPLVERLLNDLEQKALNATKDGAFTVRVASFGVVFAGTPIEVEGNKRISYLFQLFCDGVRELSILDGIDRTQVAALADVLATDIKGDTDLVSILWERNLSHVKYYAADTLSAGFQVNDQGDLILASGRTSNRLEQELGAKEITLSPDDIRMLGSDEQLQWVKESESPSRATGKMAMVAQKIREAFSTPRDTQRFVALAVRVASKQAEGAIQAPTLVLDVWDAMVAEGRLDALLNLLTSIQDTAARAQQIASDPSRAAAAQNLILAVDALLGAIGQPERMSRLAPLVEREPERLMDRLEQMVTVSRAGLVALLTELKQGPAQSRLHQILQDAGVDLTRFYADQLDAEDEEMVIHAIKSLGDLATNDAIAALAQALGRNSTSIRLAALEAMVGNYLPEARMAVIRALRDPSKECRLMACKVIESSGDKRTAAGLMSAVKNAAFINRPQEEQAAFYKALAAFDDIRILSYFKDILAKKNLMRSKGFVSQQVLAAQALGDSSAKEARNMLQEFRNYRYHPQQVKQAVDAALGHR